ncbi:unnamed protein product [Ophioblennius macclurei]
MNFDQMPSRSEVMGWSPQQLADYLKMCDLSGCDKVVMKNSISGSRFVSLTENDLQKFPKLHTPMISKISKEIGKKERKSRLQLWKSTPKHAEPEMPADVQGWDDDEFDDEDFDDDYESPYSGDEAGSGGDYESPSEDPNGGNDYEPPPSEPLEEPKPCQAWAVADGDYIDNLKNQAPSKGLPPVVNPRPPISNFLSPPGAEPRRDPSPHAPRERLSAGKFPPQPPQVIRANKPGRAAAPIPTNSGGLRGSGERPGTQSWKPPVSVPDPSTRPKVPIPPPPSTSVGRSNSSARSQSSRFEERREQTHNEGPKHNTFPLHNKSMDPRPGLPGPPKRHGDGAPYGGSLPHKPHFAMPENRGSVMDRQSFRSPPQKSASNKELDPRWYVGKLTRGQAEGCLTRVHKDGAYLVRDSTKQLDSQPFTLMVLYQDKVYNIQIRQQNQQFLLGTGLKVQESFPSVSEIIGHYSRSPLLLIDAKNRTASQQNQCLLSEPAGHYMTGQKRS